LVANTVKADEASNKIRSKKWNVIGGCTNRVWDVIRFLFGDLTINTVGAISLNGEHRLDANCDANCDDPMWQNLVGDVTKGLKRVLEGLTDFFFCI
jgi:hypothetical protein